MPQIVFDIIATLLQMQGEGSMVQIEDQSGYRANNIFQYTGRMQRAGWIEKRHHRWFLTERGKIAHAIETGRKTKARIKRQKFLVAA